jgi:hypothetical protein
MKNFVGISSTYTDGYSPALFVLTMLLVIAIAIYFGMEEDK